MNPVHQNPHVSIHVMNPYDEWNLNHWIYSKSYVHKKPFHLYFYMFSYVYKLLCMFKLKGKGRN